MTSLNIFFPFSINKEKYLTDLGRIVCDNDELISAIFNTGIRTRTKELTGEITTVVFQNDEELRFYKQIELGSTDHGEVTLEPVEGYGTIISFPVKLFKNGASLEKDVAGYIRFRIKMSTEDKMVLSQVYKPKDAKLISRLELTEIVDFRVNEIRNLPAKIRSKLVESQYITAVHFFLIRETDSEHKLSHLEFKRCRVLEKDLWDTYLNIEKASNADIPEQMLIYHWREIAKESENIDNFSAFAKFSKITVSWKTISPFIGTIVFLGVISGIFANILCAWYTGYVLTKSASNFLHEYKLLFYGVFFTLLLIITLRLFVKKRC